jgi:predicted transposase YdaD
MSKDSFVDKELRHHFSDLLYTVKHRQKDLHLYLLFEHKSSPDHWIALRAKHLPAIIPLVLYHGRKTWQIPKNFSALLNQDDDFLKQFTPEFEYLLHDFSFKTYL